MYEDFALSYDRLTLDVNYEARNKYVLSLFERFDRKPSLLLDLCCGTGAFSVQMAKEGISVIGVDISPDMLNIANEKAQRENLDILFLCQSAQELDLYGTVDGAICCLDSLNHITDYDDLCKAIKKVALFLEEGRLFIFDVNTVYKHEKVLGNNTFVADEDGLFTVWQNEYDEVNRTTYMSLDFFEEDKDGRYNRYFDTVTERAYTKEEILSALSNASLETVGIFGDMTQNPPDETSERVYFVARKCSE